jgi:hypothetical protein
LLMLGDWVVEYVCKEIKNLIELLLLPLILKNV